MLLINTKSPPLRPKRVFRISDVSPPKSPPLRPKRVFRISD